MITSPHFRQVICSAISLTKTCSAVLVKAAVQIRYSTTELCAITNIKKYDRIKVPYG